MFKKFLYTIVIIIIFFVVTGLFLPREVHVERTGNIDRPPSTVFTLLNGYRTYRIWSPWAVRDPSAEFTLSGPETGVGARLDWNGDPRLTGKGSQEVTESTPWTRIVTRLKFDQQGNATAAFDLQPRARSSEAGTSEGTSITWSFDADLTAGQSFFGGIMARYFGLLFDRWIGTDYEEGLANLKTFAESLPDVDFSDLEVEVMEVVPVDILFVQSGSSQDPGNIADALAGAYQEIMAFMQANEIEMSAPAMTITRAWDENGYDFDAAIPVTMKDVQLSGNVQAGESPSGRVVRVVHRGPYDRMMPSYEKLSAYMAAHGLREGSVSWEQYVSDPATTAPEDLVTHIYFLIEPSQPDQ